LSRFFWKRAKNPAFLGWLLSPLSISSVMDTNTWLL